MYRADHAVGCVLLHAREEPYGQPSRPVARLRSVMSRLISSTTPPSACSPGEPAVDVICGSRAGCGTIREHAIAAAWPRNLRRTDAPSAGVRGETATPLLEKRKEAGASFQ